jgi:hypothetical protein
MPADSQRSSLRSDRAPRGLRALTAPARTSRHGCCVMGGLLSGRLHASAFLQPAWLTTAGGSERRALRLCVSRQSAREYGESRIRSNRVCVASNLSCNALQDVEI